MLLSQFLENFYLKMGRTKQFTNDNALDDAMREFWTRGYHATSIPKLEVAMGISRQSIYDSFDSKQSLFLQVLKHYHQNVIVKNLSSIVDADSPKQAICQYFAARAEDALNNGEIKGCLVTNSIAELAQHNKAVGDQTNITLQYMKKVFQDAITRAKDLQEVPQNIDTESTADLLVNSAQGLFVLSRMNVTKSSVTGVVKQIEKLLAKQ